MRAATATVTASETNQRQAKLINADRADELISRIGVEPRAFSGTATDFLRLPPARHKMLNAASEPTGALVGYIEPRSVIADAATLDS